MKNIKVKNIFAAVFDKNSLNPLLTWANQPAKPGFDAKARLSSGRFSEKPGFTIRFWGTEGTVGWLQSKGLRAVNIVQNYDYGGRVKSLDRVNFVRILADPTRKDHAQQLKKEKLEPIDTVIVDLYDPDPKIFPESMDIGGMSLIRAAIKNYKNVALAFDKASIKYLVTEIKGNGGFTTEGFRLKQAKNASKFIAKRVSLEANLFKNV